MEEATKSITFTTHIGLLTHLQGMHYMFIPERIIDFFESGFNKRLIANVNGKIQWQCGFMSLSKGNGYISITNKRMKSLGVTEGSEIELELTEDFSTYGVEVAEEFQAVLDQDIEGHMRFESLKPALQRYMLNYVSAVKNTDKRLERAIMLIGNLKLLPPGKEEFRQMLGLPARD